MNILLVAEKQSIINIFKQIIAKYDEFKQNNYYFDLVNNVLHENDDVIRIRYVNGEYFQCRTKQPFKALQLDSLDIPAHTFLEYETNKKSNINFSIIDKVISICDYDACGILAFAKYLEDNNISYAEMCTIADLTEQNIYYNLLNTKSFDEIFTQTKNKLIEENFKAEWPRTDNFYKLRQECNMTRKELSTFLNIPYRTIENWEFDINRCPKYVYELILYKLKNEGKLK